MAAEKNFENRVKKWLESIGVYPLGTPTNKMTVDPIGYYEKRWGGGMFTKSGLPDMHAVIKGKSYEIELKSDTGKPSELQLVVLKQIRTSGGFGIVLRPANFEIFKKIIMGEIANASSKL